MDCFSRLNDPSLLRDERRIETMCREYKLVYGKFLPKDKNARILDVGCGMGHFLVFLKREGYVNSYGIDRSEDMARYAGSVGCSVECCDAFDYLKKHKGEFDMVVATDVIEHIERDRTVEFLQLVRESLKDEGKAMIKTFNMLNPLYMHLRYIDFTHATGFNEYSLHQVLDAAGFRKIRLFPMRASILNRIIDGIMLLIINTFSNAKYSISSSFIVAIAEK